MSQFVLDLQLVAFAFYLFFLLVSDSIAGTAVLFNKAYCIDDSIHYQNEGFDYCKANQAHYDDECNEIVLKVWELVSTINQENYIKDKEGNDIKNDDKL